MKDMTARSPGIAMRDFLPVSIICNGGDGRAERVVGIRKIHGDRIIVYCRLRRRISV